MNKKKHGMSTTALKALRTLEIIADTPDELSVSDVAERMQTDKTTAYRMLLTLEEAGYVTRNEYSKRFKLAYKVVSLSRNLLAENEVSKLILQTLRDISSSTEETLHFSVLDGYESVLIHRVKGSHLVNVDFQIGDRAPLHATSIGKVLLAFQDYRFIEEILSHDLPKYTENTIIDPDTLRRELQHIRSQGYALDDHEYSDSMRCIAVPVFEGGGRLAGGISISGPDFRFTYEKLENLREPIVKGAQDLSRHLGGLPW
jgi:DNA-binding IclR family transcriptional regulator